MKRHLFQDDNSWTVYVCVYVLGRRKAGYGDNIKKANAEAVRKERERTRFEEMVTTQVWKRRIEES